jgi:hypothetical protein
MMEDAEGLPEPGLLAQEFADDLQAAMSNSPPYPTS